jgi:hypothetical protein
MPVTMHRRPTRRTRPGEERDVEGPVITAVDTFANGRSPTALFEQNRGKTTVANRPIYTPDSVERSRPRLVQLVVWRRARSWRRCRVMARAMAAVTSR